VRGADPAAAELELDQPVALEVERVAGRQVAIVVERDVLLVPGVGREARGLAG